MLAKKKQDPRIDLPTIGLNTLKQCKAAGLKGIVLKHKKNIFLDKKKSIAFTSLILQVSQKLLNEQKYQNPEHS